MNEETKRCPKCEVVLPVSNFSKRANGKCIAYCKACQSLYMRFHYVANKDDYFARRLLSNRRSIDRNRAYALEFLRTHPCVDCGQTDPILLDFDHIDPSTKTAAVSNLIRCAYGLARIKAEIERCVVRCVKCHRNRTAEQFSWNAGAQ
jgi:hypothetical protein